MFLMHKKKGYFVLRDRKLHAAMNTELDALRKSQNKKKRDDYAAMDKPIVPGDMTVKGLTKDGRKKIYVWGHADRGRVEVTVTPRDFRPTLQEGASSWLVKSSREKTPDRALRKMHEKLRSLLKKQAKGQHERIVAKMPVQLDPTPTWQTQASHCADIHQDGWQHSVPPLDSLAEHSAKVLTERKVHPSNCKLEQKLNHQPHLEAVTECIQFLQSIRLHYCTNCDEEWPVFDVDWPQRGKAWAGAKAGKCETIERTGFKAGKNKDLCSRCESSKVYKDSYCARNLQHLGKRHALLDRLTWYESLLVARVHPMMSVITLSSTGLLCYAGHVCNYYVKTLEWFKTLPAILTDKGWFLIKPRRSVRRSDNEMRHRKPTTANRTRLEAAIAVLQKNMPHVYKDSYVVEEDLNKFPVDGEQEMLEQEETLQDRGSITVQEETSLRWLQRHGDMDGSDGSRKYPRAVEGP